jgi:hypothetical protein
MDDKVIELLGVVVQQNAELIRQNREFIDFIQKRDASVAELQLANLEAYREDRAQRTHVYETLGIGRGDLVLIATLKELGLYDAGKEIRERLKAAGKLPEKSV